METNLTVKPPLSGVAKFCDLYWEDLKNFYCEAATQQINETEKFSIFSWSVPAPLRVAVVGEYNHGKSSLINFLLDRKNLLPVSPKRETKITTYIYPLYYSNFDEFGMNREHAILFNTKEKGSRIIQLSDIKSVINDPAVSPDSYVLSVYLKNPLLNNNVVFIDTPGFSVEKETEWYPVEFAKLSDLVILVSDLNKPFTKYHDRFMQMLGPHIRKVIHVINKVDLAASSTDVRDALTHVISHQREIALCHPRFFVSVLDTQPDQNWLQEKIAADKASPAGLVQTVKAVNPKEKEKPGASTVRKEAQELMQRMETAFKKREWDNKKFWKYVQGCVSQSRSLYKSENWSLLIAEMAGAAPDSHEGELHKILNEMQATVRGLKSKVQSWNDVCRHVSEDRLITNSSIDEKIRELEEELKKIVHECSNASNVTIAEAIAKCTKKKEIEDAQRQLKDKIQRQLKDSLDRALAVITERITSINLNWFKLLSEVPDGRIIDETLSPSRADELRRILYNYLFEEQYFFRHSNWRQLLNLLEQKGFANAVNRQTALAWFLRRMRSFCFDCNSSEYLFHKIMANLSPPDIATENRQRALKVEWREIKAPALLLFDSSIKKYQAHVQDSMQKCQVAKFKGLSELISAFINAYRQQSVRALMDLETSFRNTLASEVVEIRNGSFQEPVKAIAQQLNGIFEGISLPFQSIISAK